MTLGILLLLFVVILLIGSIPLGRSWGYYPSVGLALIAVVLLVLILLGRL